MSRAVRHRPPESESVANSALSPAALAALVASLWILVPAPSAGADRGSADPLAVLSAKMRGSRGVPTEAEWATDLAEVLGIDEILPEDAEAGERFALLCADRAATPDTDGRDLAGASPTRVTAAAPAGAGPGSPVRLVVQVPATALYLFSIEGVGLQRWLVDGRLLGHLDPSLLGVAQAASIVALREGPHELSGTLAPDARVDRVELAAHRSLCIAPADGWHPQRPLRYAVLARTLVHVLGLESQLPVAGVAIPVEGEDFVESTGGAEVSERRLRNDPSGRRWARASDGPAEFVYRIELDEPGLFSLEARLPGGGAQFWSVDGRYRATVRPLGASASFAWNPVLTLPLASGRHVVRAFVSQGSGVDRMRLVPHRPSGAAYVAVLGRAGFGEGAPDAQVSRRVARRSLARLREAPEVDRFLSRYAHGTGRALPEDEGAAPGRPAPPAAPDPVLRPETWR